MNVSASWKVLLWKLTPFIHFLSLNPLQSYRIILEVFYVYFYYLLLAWRGHFVGENWSTLEGNPRVRAGNHHASCIPSFLNRKLSYIKQRWRLKDNSFLNDMICIHLFIKLLNLIDTGQSPLHILTNRSVYCKNVWKGSGSMRYWTQYECGRKLWMKSSFKIETSMGIIVLKAWNIWWTESCTIILYL